MIYLEDEQYARRMSSWKGEVPGDSHVHGLLVICLLNFFLPQERHTQKRVLGEIIPFILAWIHGTSGMPTSRAPVFSQNFPTTPHGGNYASITPNGAAASLSARLQQNIATAGDLMMPKSEEV